jgi:hypothetical protein
MPARRSTVLDFYLAMFVLPLAIVAAALALASARRPWRRR